MHCYLPPNVQQSDCIENLGKCINCIHRENSYVYFTGETNFNTRLRSIIVNEYHNLFLSYQHPIDKPRREIHYSTTLIDHVYTNIPQYYM